MRSDFSYHTRESQKTKVLVIIDLNKGGMSVTNNVEEVVKSIAAELGEKTLMMPIIYRDSEGIYDGIDATYLDNPFYSIQTADEQEAAYSAATRYWEQNTIHFARTRAWRRRGDRGEVIKVPDKLQQIQNTWAEWSKKYGDKGSCVLGAGFEFDYEGQRYKMPPTGPWQGSCSWEASKDQVEQLLEKAGASNIKYHWGHMD